MARTDRDLLSPRFLLGVAAAGLFLCAVLPPRWTRWVDWFRRPVVFLVSPIQSAIGSAAVAVRGDGAAGDDSERVAALERAVAELKVAVNSANAENDQLRAVIRDMQRGREWLPDLDFIQIPAPVIGTAADLSSGVLLVRAGEREGVEPNAVAVAEGVRLVGQVRTVTARTATVAPITGPAAKGQPIAGVIMIGDATRGPGCSLFAQGDGTLSGMVDAEPPAELAVGMLVRLDDPSWPATARMLEVGRVVSVGSAPDQPLRKIVTVRPETDPSRLSEVWIRVLAQPAGSNRIGGGSAETPRRNGA